LKKEKIRFISIAFLIAATALILDIFSSQFSFEVISKSYIGTNEEVIKTLEVSFPLWHQIIGLVKNFLYGLAAAIVITVFVSNEIEKNQREEKEKELKELSNAININVFDSLFKTIIPEEIFKAIKQDVIENKVVRRNAKWVFNFREQGGRVLCNQTTYYQLHNLSQASVDDPVRLDLDALGGDEYKVLLAECLNTSGETIVLYDISKPHEKKNIELKIDGNKLTVEYTVTIPPQSYVEYKTVYERSYPGDATDFQGTKVPVIGLEIIANFPEHYEFNISPVMSTPPKLILEQPNQKIYRVDGGILPRQGMVFSISKKKPTPEQQSLIFDN